MSYELIITEKPKAAEKIANALAEGRVIKETYKKVPYYKITRGNKDIVVCCAVGHLYGLEEKDKKGWTYPVFDIKWVPSYTQSNGAKFTKKYFDTIKKVCKDADSFVLACDYDVEGELIGFNVLRFLCKKDEANRMKFSTLTKDDLINSYEKKDKTINHGLANAGETRHELDWFYGINLSRALTFAIKSAGFFKVLSSGRVQGPALKIIVDRDREIKKFKPTPFWQIELKGDVRKEDITAMHENDKFWDKKKADNVMNNVKGQKKAAIKDVEKKKFKQNPPAPFDLTTMQIEAYRALRIAPKESLAMAQELYTSGFISYPRTSSQKLPKEIGYKKILQELSKQKNYSGLCKDIMKGQLSPNEGKSTDPAHPAIYPTGVPPSGIKNKELKLYDLIVKRFMAVFGEPATKQTMTIKIDCNKEIFVAKGTTTLEKGWHKFYSPYVPGKEEELPNVKEKDEVSVKRITLLDKETQPPKHYTPASIIKELAKRNLGTKATRAQIVDTLFQRGYVNGKSIEATDLGISAVETLEKYCPRILDEELTRHFELEMEEIEDGKKKPKEILDEAKERLNDILSEFKKKEKIIGESLKEATIETRNKESFIGKCPNCKEGNLRVIFSKKTKKRFIACDAYPKCKTTFSLPQKGLVKSAEKQCPECGYPMVMVITKGRRPWVFCINPDCKGPQQEK
jgi:DNA topoisomerase-1